MAGTALQRLGSRWRTARLIAARDETATARTLRFAVPGWPGHLAGQHVDLRLTAEDGYTAQRSYSLSAPDDGGFIEVTVQLVADGEVSTYLVRDIQEGDVVEVLGPLGGWFVWRPEQPEPVLLIGGGSGVAPLMAMLRARASSDATPPIRLLYSVRTPTDVYFADELLNNPDTVLLYTRQGPDDVERTPHRFDQADLKAHGLPPDQQPTCYVCGPTPFVETVTALLTEAGHDPTRVRAERFGG
jgi:ferredoxin-NADP reductase